MKQWLCSLCLIGWAWLPAQSLSPDSLQQALQSWEWQRTRVARGIHWESVQADQWLGSAQSISVLRVKRNRRFALATFQDTYQTPGSFGEQHEAVAAVNGGFFSTDTSNRGSVTFLKVDDQLISPHAAKLTPETHAWLTTGAVAIDGKGRLQLLAKGDTAELKDPANFDDVLFTGPVLLEQGIFSPNNWAASEVRHPRTCMCQTEKGHTLLVVVDGRNEQAAGMKLSELSQFLKALDCEQALNLDGGGSSAMWTRKFGVVSHPSDNRRFDGEGERKVANVLLVF